MIIHTMKQGTEEWFEIKKCKLSASHGTEIAANGAGLKTYVNNLILDLIVERERFTGADMERGTQLEPIARMKYEFETNQTVTEVGFIENCSYSGYSPDGLVGTIGLIEIKCRNNSKHFDLLRGAKVDSCAIWQMQMGLMITKREWCDFISYNPNFRQSILIERFFVDPIAQQKLKVGLEHGIEMLKSALQENSVKKEMMRL